MKILICVHNLSNGGAERVASLWIKGFVNHGYDVHLATCELDAPIDYDIPENVESYLITASGSSIIRYIRKVLLLRKLLKRIKPDVAIGILKPWNYWLVFASMGMRIPLINTEHDSFERPPSAPMPKTQWFDKYIWNFFFNVVTVLTEADKRLINGKYKNIFVLPNPLSFTPSEVNEKEKKQIVIAAGRLDIWHCKGFDNLINAWGSIANKYPGWKLVVAGNGSEGNKNYLRKLADSTGKGTQIDFIGFRHNLVDDFRQSEVFVLSSRYEGFGMVLIEAMSQGCACVACDYGGRQAEIIEDGINGLLTPADDWRLLANKIDCLLSDEMLRRSLQHEAIKRSRDFEIDKIIERWESIFHLHKIE